MNSLSLGSPVQDVVLGSVNTNLGHTLQSIPPIQGAVMARQDVEVHVCDICGAAAEGGESVRLGWNGDAWQIDLCTKDYGRVADRFDTWIVNAELAPRTRRTRTTTSRSTA